MQNFNLHTHTKRCHHAEGKDEDYVLKAIENGYKVMGFSDHAPYIFPKEHISSFRMETELAGEYVKSVKNLKDKYRDKIDIKLGFEVEWYPKFIKDELNYLKCFDYDYIILGQHYTGSEVEDFARYTGSKTTELDTLERYINQVLEGASSGEFLYVAHPDLINFIGDSDIYQEKMTSFVKELKKIDIPLEFNFLGFTDKRNYPNDTFWKIVSEVGNRVVIGLDAHNPEVYADKQRLKKAQIKLKELNITPVTDINELL